MALGDVYNQLPQAFSQQVNQQGRESFSQLPGLAQQKFQMDAAQAEQQRQNAPLSPWEQAAIEAMEDPKGAAQRLKAKLAGAPAGIQGGGPVAGGAAIQMPQPMGMATRTSTPYGNVTRGPQYMGDETGMAGPAGIASVREPNPMYKGMTHRDYTEHMGTLGNIAKIKTDRDYVAEIREKNKGGRDVATINAGAKKEVAQLRADQMHTDHEASVAEKAESRKELAAYRKEVIRVADRKIDMAKQLAKFRTDKGKKDPKLEALLKLYKGAIDEMRTLELPDNVMLNSGKLKERTSEIAEKIQEIEAQLREHVQIMQAEEVQLEEGETPPIPTETPIREPGGAVAPLPAQGGPPQSSYPKQVKLNGKVRNVKGIDANGKYILE